MDKAAGNDDELVTLCNSLPRGQLLNSLLFVLRQFRKRDRERFNRVQEKLKALIDAAKGPSYNPELEASILWFAGLRPFSRAPLHNRTVGLIADAETAMMWLTRTPRKEWGNQIREGLPFLMPLKLPPLKRKELQEALEQAAQAGSVRQGMLAILHMAGWGDPANISSRLSRANRPRRLPKP